MRKIQIVLLFSLVVNLVLGGFFYLPFYRQ